MTGAPIREAIPVLLLPPLPMNANLMVVHTETLLQAFHTELL